MPSTSTSTSLTPHDLTILSKIQDPEKPSSTSSPLIDASLPRDPHITDAATYAHITALERGIISSIQDVELQLAGLNSNLEPGVEDPLKRYRECVERLGALVEEYPEYASAKNNRAQALRRIFGDGVLVRGDRGKSNDEAVPLDSEASEEDLMTAGSTILEDLSTAIRLLMPLTPFMAISSQAAKTLSQAYTQRGALYHLTAKSLSVSTQNTSVRIDPNRPEANWSVVDFEENASRDFVMGARYGNQIAGKLAVGANPTAKLCGEMVREALRREFGGGGVA